MSPKIKFKRVTDAEASIPATTSQKRHAPSPSSGLPPQTKFKSMTNFMQNDNTIIPAIISRKRHVPSTFSDFCTRILPQTKSKRKTSLVHDDGTLMPYSISQNSRAPTPPTDALVNNRVAIEEQSPMDNEEHECEFPPSNEEQERDFEDIHESNSSHVHVSFTSTCNVRKTRGPVQISTFNPPEGKKWTCVFIRGQPVGKPASKLAGTLGLYARNESYFSPYKKWKEQSIQSFHDVMKEIMLKFDFVDEEGMPANMDYVNMFCMKSIHNKVKDWRCNLKKKGFMNGVNEELSVDTPENRITQVTWDSLVQYWGTEEKIQEAERNKKNRDEEQATHTLGAKSIARHNQEQREKLGESYTTLDAYIKAHQTKSRDYLNEHTRSICEKVIAACEEKDLTSSSDPSVLSPLLDTICNGHHGGYERGCGLGWSRMSHWGNIINQGSNENIKKLTIELENAKAEIEALNARDKEREEAMQAKQIEMQKWMERMEAMLFTHMSNRSVNASGGDNGLPHSEPSCS